MKEIGGYFGLELRDGGRYYHRDAFQFQTGRAALYFILSNAKPKHIHVPFYTCNALLQPIIALGIPFSFYAIDENLEIVEQIKIKPDEFIIYINYYDIKQSYVKALSESYQDRLIVDCSQSYFTKGNGISWYFNSARKFFGVPDGADLYTPNNWTLFKNYLRLYANTIYSIEHLVARFNGRTQEGYDSFIINEELVGVNYDKMSVFSKAILSHIDYQDAQTKRMINFKYVHSKLGHLNKLKILPNHNAAPSYYPYLPQQLVDKKIFWKEGMYIPVLWQDCIERNAAGSFDFEKSLSGNIFPIPVDHRYTATDLDRIIDFLNTTNYNGFYNKI